jgi:hypothetical protein
MILEGRKSNMSDYAKMLQDIAKALNELADKIEAESKKGWVLLIHTKKGWVEFLNGKVFDFETVLNLKNYAEKHGDEVQIKEVL